MELLSQTSPEFFVDTFERIDAQSYSDLHKDVYGFRPRDLDRWEAMTGTQQNAEYDELCRELARVMDDEAEMERQAIIELDARLDGYVTEFGIDFATALRWAVEGEDCDPACEQGVGFFLWKNGIHKWENVRRYLDALGVQTWRTAA